MPWTLDQSSSAERREGKGSRSQKFQPIGPWDPLPEACGLAGDDSLSAWVGRSPSPLFSGVGELDLHGELVELGLTLENNSGVAELDLAKHEISQEARFLARAAAHIKADIDPGRARHVD